MMPAPAKAARWSGVVSHTDRGRTGARPRHSPDPGLEVKAGSLDFEPGFGSER
jgi:hypothetical protein